MCPIYTKTFGGKIWNNLHSVSPDNFFDKYFNRVPALIFPAKSKFNIPHLEHKLTKKFSSQICDLSSQKVSVQDGILYDDIMLNEQLEIYLQKWEEQV